MTEQPATKKISLAQTPVRRALDRSKKTLLLGLILVGFLIGIVYKQASAPKTPAPETKPAVSSQQKQ